MSMNEEKELKVGDVIYSYRYGILENKYIIERTTKTLAITANGLRFRKKVNRNGYVSIVPIEEFSEISYWLESEEIKKQDVNMISKLVF